MAKLLSEELFKKYSDLSIQVGISFQSVWFSKHCISSMASRVQNFVDKNRDIKWCPFPDCGQAVMLKETTVDCAIFGDKQGINVECGRGHGFCW